MGVNVKLTVLRLTIDFTVFAGLVAGIFLLKDLATPTNRGFFCDDQSIRYPNKKSALRDITLYFIGFGVALVTMLLVELKWMYKQIEAQKWEITMPMPSLSIKDATLQAFFQRLYIIYGSSILGALTCIFLSQGLKFYVGRLRPDFIEVCKVDWSATPCHSKNSTLPGSVYIPDPDIFCLNDDLDEIREAKLSFPSQHASASFYFAVLLIFYLEARLVNRWMFAACLKPLLQFLCILFAFFVSASRFVDYKHHASDIIIGATIGIAFGFFTVFYLANNFRFDGNRNETLTSDNYEEYVQIIERNEFPHKMTGFF